MVDYQATFVPYRIKLRILGQDPRRQTQSFERVNVAGSLADISYTSIPSLGLHNYTFSSTRFNRFLYFSMASSSFFLDSSDLTAECVVLGIPCFSYDQNNVHFSNM